MGKNSTIILASASPRRSEILTSAGIPFTVKAADVEERILPGESPAIYVQRLAREKAAAIESEPGDTVLAADTVVVLDEHILEKPADIEDAKRMLRMLSGREHEVMTGICLRRAGKVVTDHARTRVRFVPLSEEDIESYAGTGEPMDKAGAYAIQGGASKYIDSISGCYFNVVGLPVALVFRHLRAMNARPDRI